MNSISNSSESKPINGMFVMSWLLFVSLLVMSACMKHQECDKLFDRVDSLMYTHPDSAIIILKDIRSGNFALNKSDKMRSLLLLAKAQNLAYATMPDDSIFEEVVEYYDRNGSSNDQVLAHYLHGCISRDLNDAPKALERYMEAVAHADTTDTDCDYSTLLGVYGQMSNIFYLQNLPKEEIQALEKAGYYSLKAGNIRNYIKCIELHMRPYYEMDDTAAIIETTFRARNLYLKNGFIQEAASVYPYAIFIYLKQGRFEEAHKMMEDFECHSGLFSNGEIEPRRRQYEYSRGMYFEGINQLDSAEYYYRKVLAYGFHFEGYKGLLSLYCTKEKLDSVKKYAPLYVQSVDEAAAKQQTEAVLKMKSLYDYTQSRKEAEKQKQKAERWKSILYMILLAGLIIAVTAMAAYRSYRRKKEAELEHLTDSYARSNEILEMQRQQMVELKNDIEGIKRVRKWAAMLRNKFDENKDKGNCDYEQEGDEAADDIKSLLLQMDEMIKARDGQLAKKQSEIDKLSQENKDIETRLALVKGYDGLEKLVSGQIVQIFKAMADEDTRRRKPNERDWNALKKYFQLQAPEFYVDIKELNGLSEIELRAALLVSLGFSNQELKTILGKSDQHVRNIKARINQKLFGLKGATKLLFNITQKYGKMLPPIQ